LTFFNKKYADKFDIVDLELENYNLKKLESVFSIIKNGGLISVLLGEVKLNYFPELGKGLYLFDFDNHRPVSE
jgi:hypothetical protein